MTSRPARPATRRLVINWPLIEQRRIAAGLTQAQLTDRIRGGALTGRGRLWTDADHDDVPLGLLERLCQVLDLHPAELFCPPTRAAHRRALVPEQPPADSTVLEAALATLTVPAGTTGTPIGMAALADALGWSLDRLGTAVAALTECHRDLDPEVIIALQQRGIIRRHPRGDYLELTDDAQFSLAPEMPRLSQSEH